MNLKELLKEKVVKASDLANVIWPDSKQNARYVLVKRLIDGKMYRFPINRITSCCKLFDDMSIHDFINVLIETNRSVKK